VGGVFLTVQGTFKVRLLWTGRALVLLALTLFVSLLLLILALGFLWRTGA
jgi:hypothetical protein